MGGRQNGRVVAGVAGGTHVGVVVIPSPAAVGRYKGVGRNSTAST